jgi:hypothetical protein
VARNPAVSAGLFRENETVSGLFSVKNGIIGGKTRFAHVAHGFGEK